MNPRKPAVYRKKKGQRRAVGLGVMVEAAGIEPASADHPPSIWGTSITTSKRP